MRCQSVLCNILEEIKFHLHYGGSLKSHMYEIIGK